jgi:hypothetical protein
VAGKLDNLKEQNMKLFLVVSDIDYCLIWASDREDAKRQAKPHLLSYPEHYEVTLIAPAEYHLKAIVFDKVVINNKYQV